MKWASVCSGIGAPEVAWGDIFGPPAFQAEIELRRIGQDIALFERLRAEGRVAA